MVFDDTSVDRRRPCRSRFLHVHVHTGLSTFASSSALLLTLLFKLARHSLCAAGMELSCFILPIVLFCYVFFSPKAAEARVHHAYPDPLCESAQSDQQPAACSQGGRSLRDCVAALQHAGDECRLHAGRYFFRGEPLKIRGLHGTGSLPYVIAAYSPDEGRVVLDGTAPLSSDWKPFDASAHSGIFVTDTPHDVWQIFVDDEMQTNARWPNALWSDKSVFNVSYWAASANISKPGLMVDDGSKGRVNISKQSYSMVTAAILLLNLFDLQGMVFDEYLDANIVLNNREITGRQAGMLVVKPTGKINMEGERTGISMLDAEQTTGGGYAFASMSSLKKQKYRDKR